MNRGSVYAIETLFIFLGWMLILTLVWGQSANHTHHMVENWKELRLNEKAIAQSDALLLQHHINPWNGCARFDESMRRGLPYVIEKSCLEKLSHLKETEGIFEIAIRKNGNRTIYFNRESGERNCIAVARPGILFPEQSVIIVEVKACEE